MKVCCQQIFKVGSVAEELLCPMVCLTRRFDAKPIFDRFELPIIGANQKHNQPDAPAINFGFPIFVAQAFIVLKKS